MRLPDFIRRGSNWLLATVFGAILGGYAYDSWKEITAPIMTIDYVKAILIFIGLISFGIFIGYLALRHFGWVNPKETVVVSKAESTQTQQLTPMIFQPVRYYGDRHALQMEQFLEDVETVEMVAITHRDLTEHNIGLIRKPLSGRANVTVLILNPDSTYVSIHENAYHAADNIKEQIRISLGLLCDEKRALENTNQQDRLVIRKYDYLCPHSITIINRNNPEKAWIRVEDRPLGSVSNERPSYTTYRKDDSKFFDIYSNEYDIIFSHSREEKN